MAGEQLPFQKIFWATTQKHAPNNYEQRFRLFGAIIGNEDELVFVRHPVDLLGLPYQTDATVASQTGLHIQILDPRNVRALKLSKVAANGGDFIRCYDIAADGTETATGGAGNNGVWADGSLRELKKNMKDLTETQIQNILEKLKVYRFNFINDNEAVVYVGPEAAEFHELTKWGDGRTIAPGTIAGIALRLVQWVWGKVVGIEERLKAIENRLDVTEGSDSAQDV